MQTKESKADTGTGYQRNPAGRKCAVCDHPQLKQIDSLLADCTVSKRGIAVQFDLSPMSVVRHSQSHVPTKVANALKRSQAAEEDMFLNGIKATVQSMAKGVAHGMAALDDGLIEPELAFRMAPAMAAQQLRALELLGQATGRLNQQAAKAGDVHLHVVLPRELAPAGSPTAIEGDCQVIQSPSSSSED